MTSAVRTSWTVGLPPDEAMAVAVAGLAVALARSGVTLADGRLSRGPQVLGDVVEQSARALVVRWRRPSWSSRAPSIGLSATPDGDGATLTVEVTGLAVAAGFADDDATAWFASEIAGSVLGATLPDAVGGWLAERRGGRPSGRQARSFYADPHWHRPAFDAVLRCLAPGPADRLIEVGCGGGVFLEAVLGRGARAVGVDHSRDMIDLAAERNAAAVRDGRLELVHGDAVALPFEEGRFTCATAIGAFGWLADQRAALVELHRVLGPGGRLALYTGAPEIAGTPAAPEPIAGRLTLRSDDELRTLVCGAGFRDVNVGRPDLRRQARSQGLDDVELFAGPYAQLVTAVR